MRNDSPTTQRGRRPEPIAGRVLLIPAIVMILTVAVFVSAILLMTAHLKERLYSGIVQQDAKVIQATAGAELSDSLGETQEDQINNAIIAGATEDVFAIRVFDSRGRWKKIKFTEKKGIVPADLPQRELDLLEQGEPIAQFEPHHDVNADFVAGTLDKIIPEVPVVRTVVPIKTADGKFAAFAEYLLNGEGVQRQLRQVDREVRQSALWFSLTGSLVILIALGWAFSRLNQANALLARRTANLLHANHELALAAKTSALGAVAAHLIHGLKNPLFGLQAFVTAKAEDLQGEGSDWKIAADAAHRMQMMIADIVRVLREDAADQYEVSLAEIAQVIEGKVKAMAREADVRVIVETRASGKVANREANLLILAMTNLIHNAIQASKPGKKIQLLIYPQNESICLDVIDEAGGIPKEMRELLFTPIQSTKPGGTGLGLAITKQLANHMGGQLELAQTNEHGTTFRLAMPANLLLLSATGAKNALEPNAVA
jgi:signal transduction histidine kinase